MAHFTASLLLLTIVSANARLAKSPPTQEHQLATEGVANDRTEANPEIDAWHDQEKARIEAECNAMMAKLSKEKADKLKAIVEDAVSRVERERRRLTEAERKVRQELADVDKEKCDLEAAKAKKTRLSPTKESLEDVDKKIKALNAEIGKKKACLEELRVAEESLLCSEKKLADALKKLEKAETAHKAQTIRFLNENGDIPPAQADLESAEEDLARAQARHAIAMHDLNTAETDLAEHDGAGSEQSQSSTSGGTQASSDDSSDGASKKPKTDLSKPSGATPTLSVGPVLSLLLVFTIFH